ncbi:dihydrolipoyllysine-residue acetyltransferase [Alcaligenes faecalis]|jgi:pyruvate dehydrogenase E2 component (dihydrolipoamide acetyltransferase)|uniref:Acetyltransferase component of pyruvate dehydrogenase complex n=2 Tax=Alcaligenes faecalis TaxID=511 RepID=A0AAE9HB23_ALCFA|nr:MULTISPECIES: dihydrolipoyllysine-residue acetyltransferase [Alcaligenes]MDH4865345.1 dihydrolipoyllysine-residue acetyltransferase [Bacillus cereus]MCM2558889.1 dihydrolipoyllysine-residue acetyltransferase [Alcaligenes faecalis]MCX5470272.1 dihydrolipoyllysine-residue acetyltransferase [Alcaligenes nematophilus]MDK7585494.1 dihydrolipoyllysine-residue acetyltransferase [Alcaligenes phenolicus]MDY7126644.1 dihydrolipoyllysine-residue acetyltransferase [Alcaligenes nematophilus]
MSNIIQVKIPDIGADDAVEVIEILVKEGETIEVEQSLITVESDKASMEIPSSDAGVVKSIKVKLGDKVKEGSLVLELEAAEGAQAAPAAEPAKAEAAPAPKAEAAPAAAPAAAAAAPAGGEQQVTVQVPDIGDARDVDVIEIMVQVGDTIEVDQSLITVESDKASMEVPSSHAGVVTAIKVKLGDKVSQGSDILELTVQGAAAAPAPAKAEAAPAPKAEPAPAAAAAPAASSSVVVGAGAPAPERVSPTAAFAETEGSLRNLPHASPSVRKFARELGVDLTKVHGSGDKGRITADDVRGFVKQVMAGGAAPVIAAGTAAQVGGLDVLAWPKVDFAKFGPVETQALSRIKKISGANLHRNWVMIPHVTNNDVADITSLEALRKELNEEYKKSGARVTMLAFVIKAAVAALKKFPEFNASLDGDNLVLKQYYHIGFAADTPNGLVVPVIRDADKKGILDIARETGELAAAARDGKLSAAQMQGGCFTISSLGGIGGTDFTPIINAPEVAILGLSRSSMQPVWNGKEFEPRLMLPLSLSYDHRVIDGAAAARFNAFLATMLADFRRIAL